MKTFINDADNCVKHFLSGIQASYPGLSVDVDSQIVLLNRNRGSKVAVVSGGGSGHEPFGAGYVGENMLTGVICGSVFASPPSKMIYKGLLNLVNNNKGGILVLIMNYTGDRLNFGMAIERLKQKGIKIESVVVSDDCVSLLKESNSVGRRGCSGIALISKIIGGMSSCGVELGLLQKEAEEINSRMFTISAAIEPCTLPGNKEPLWKLQNGQMEIGVGVHGEKGIQTIEMSDTKDLVKILLKNMEKVVNLGDNESYVILINNLGACTELEMYLIAHEVNTQIEKWNISLKRLYVGKMMSSVDMKGVQITAFNVTNKSDWLAHLDQSTEAFGWPFTPLNYNVGPSCNFIEGDFTNLESDGMVLNETEAKVFKGVLTAACRDVEAAEVRLNQLDSGCGDGDCGSCLKRLALGILNNLDKWKLTSVSETLLLMSDMAESCMGGSSGALYSLMFLGAAQNPQNWLSIWKSALDKLQQYSKAQVGDRTMIDALVPAFESFSRFTLAIDSLEAFRTAVEKAEEGCRKTAFMTPRFGRASYVDASVVKDVDAGAFGVVVWMKAILKALETK